MFIASYILINANTNFCSLTWSTVALDNVKTLFFVLLIKASITFLKGSHRVCMYIYILSVNKSSYFNTWISSVTSVLLRAPGKSNLDLNKMTVKM